MKVVIRVWKRQSPPDAPGDFGSEPLFGSLARRSRSFPYVLSASLHAVCIWAPIIGTAGQPREKPQEAVYASKALMIRLIRPEPVPEVNRTRLSNRAENPARDLRTRAWEIISALNRLKEKKVPAVNKPAVPAGNQAAGSQTEAILIQPQYPLEMRPPLAAEAVPSILLWSGQPQRMPPKPAPPPVPGVRQIPAPVLEPPVLNTDANRPNFVLSELGPPSRPAATPESIKLLSISDAPATRDIIIVPPGNLIPSAMPVAPAETKQAGASGAPGLPAEILPAAPPAVRTASAEAKANGKGISPVLRISEVSEILAAVATERNNPIPPPAPKPDSTVGQTETSVPAGPPRATGTPAGRASPVPEVKSGNATPAPALTGRLEHPPNGRHDVIIVQSTLDDATPGISGLLTGKPIHTAYLKVGDATDWILHYCSRDSAVVQSGIVFHLPDPRPLQAPYPSLTFLPAEPIIADVPYVLVHGLIDEAGMMQKLKVVGPIQSWTAALLTALTQWKFRPAARAETPEPVEIVLAIPGRKK